MAKRTSNWERLRNLRAGETNQYRDVYDDQQLERSYQGQNKQTMTARKVVAAALTIMVFFLSYFVIGFFTAVIAMLYGREGEVTYSLSYYIAHFSFTMLLVCLIISASFYGIMYVILKHNLDVQNSLDDTADIISLRFQIGLSPARNTIELRSEINAMSLYEITGTSLVVMVYEAFPSFCMNNRSLSFVIVLESVKD